MRKATKRTAKARTLKDLSTKVKDVTKRNAAQVKGGARYTLSS